MNDVEVAFRGWHCRLVRTRYAVDDSPALLLIHAATGEPIAKCTVNAEGADLAPGEVIIKDYGENAGMLECLVEAGIVEPTGREVALPHGIMVPVCRLLEGGGAGG